MPLFEREREGVPFLRGRGATWWNAVFEREVCHFEREGMPFFERGVSFRERGYAVFERASSYVVECRFLREREVCNFERESMLFLRGRVATW